MKISEFVEKMAVRFDSKLKTQQQIDAFRDDCKDHLKNYEGELLGHTFHEILATRKSRTHPTTGEIRKIASQKAHQEHAKKHEHNPEAEKWQKTKSILDNFQNTDLFKKCAVNMIGNDVLVFIKKKARVPTDEDLRRLFSARQEFLRILDGMRNDTEISPLQLELFRTGQAMEEKNKMYFNQFNQAA